MPPKGRPPKTSTSAYPDPFPGQYKMRTSAAQSAPSEFERALLSARMDETPAGFPGEDFENSDNQALIRISSTSFRACLRRPEAVPCENPYFSFSSSIVGSGAPARRRSMISRAT